MAAAPGPIPKTYPLARPRGLSLDDAARLCGLHPQTLRRFVVLSLVDADRDQAGELRFGTDVPLRVARILRLRRDLSLNYAALGLVLDLLERIDLLEAELHHAREGRGPWM
ncbi:chaperone modulator CbpM [Streptomonospora wellingtoniae]|uniref:Chaperone modulator CbpM n=1 Tax=Streptomonospora wellingtoniae TaxID=3075544 RepID=A0ABU2KQ87_9ACTN|nr:chaperone modulator CbpM [Streptomonospora sp. DSM 45055]MDT0301303.1 chaperone modulator CbpM [Streptomonospora sp. DSM 45055]